MDVLFLLLLVAVGGIAKPGEGLRKRYDGYQVLEVRPTDIPQQQHVFQLRDDHEIDFWSEPKLLGMPIYVLVPPYKLDHVYDHMQQSGVAFSVYRSDIQKVLDADWERLDRRKRDIDTYEFDLDDWNSYDDIMSELENMADRCPEEAGISCETYTIGSTLEGRILKVLNIRKESGKKTESYQRKGFWLDSVIHGGEWLTVSTALKIADRMTRSYENDTAVRDLLDTYDWYILPVMNPDGYDYAFTTDTFWRKNRRPDESSECFGVDLNRNYNQTWATVGSSSDPCSNSYHGPEAASELETVAIQNEAVRLSDTVAAWVSMHTAGNMWLHPWGHTHENGSCVYAEDHDELYRVATAAADATQETYNTTWTRGTICDTIYPVGGNTLDYIKANTNIGYQYSPELRSPREVEEIEPAYREIWNGIVAIVHAIRGYK